MKMQEPDTPSGANHAVEFGNTVQLGLFTQFLNVLSGKPVVGIKVIGT